MVGADGILVVLGAAMMAASTAWPGGRRVTGLRPRSFAGAYRRRLPRIRLEASVPAPTRLAVAGFGLAGIALAAALMAASLAGAR